MDISLYFALSAMKETKLGVVVNNGRIEEAPTYEWSGKASLKSVIEAEMPHLPSCSSLGVSLRSSLSPSHCLLNLSQIWALFTLSLSLPQLRPSVFLMEIIRLLLQLDPSLLPFLSSFFSLPITCYFTSSSTLRTFKGPHMLCSLKLLCLCIIYFFVLFLSCLHLANSYSLAQVSVSRKPSFSPRLIQLQLSHSTYHNGQ